MLAVFSLGRGLRRAGLLLALLGAVPALAQSPCPPGPAPALDSTDALALPRYLARAVAMNGLCDQLVPAPFGWNVAVDGTPCYQGGPPDSLASYRADLSCAGQCSYSFCPENFAADVALLVRLRASFVQFAAGTWTGPEKFAPGSDFLRAAGQTVARINAAYDCAGLPRPLVQASVLENADPSRTCDPPARPCEPWMRPGPPGTNSGVNFVPLPARVIAEFMDELRADSTRAYYLDERGQPRTNLFFNFFRLAYRVNDANYSPDITRLEGRMWLFYQAQTFIDLGYTALHVGQPKFWGRLPNTQGTALAQGLHRVAVLMRQIRRYARSLPAGPQTLVLVAEPMSVDLPGEPVIVKFVDGTTAEGRDQYIFDMDMATMRPRETSPVLDARAHTEVNTAYKCPAVDPDQLRTPACQGQYLATIDPCHGFHFVPDGGGVTPSGQAYALRKPYSVYFDHYITVLRGADGRLVPTKVLTRGNGGTWGWDDAAWFSAALSDACQADWLRYQYANVRTFDADGLGFLAAPGRFINNSRAGLDLGLGIPDQPGAGVPDYRLAAHPLAAAATAAAWEPTMPQLALQATPGAGLPLGECPGSRLFRRQFQQLPAWQAAVQNPDATSIYSWRVLGPNGPEAPVLGPVLRYFPPTAGAYTIILQQDNLGLPPATGGRRTLALPAVPAATALCLSRADRRAARRAAAPVAQSAP